MFKRLFKRERELSMEEALEADAWASVVEDFEGDYGRAPDPDDETDRAELESRFQTTFAQLTLGFERAFGADSDLEGGEFLPGGGFAYRAPKGGQ
jgi:hypothetical protein